MTNKEIGNRIMQAREERGLNKTELADKIKVALSTITRYEEGEIARIKIPVIESIANALNVNPLWIIGEEETKEVKTNHIDIELKDTYFNFAKEMQEKNISDEDMKKLWQFYEMIKHS